MGALVLFGLFFVCETPRYLESVSRSVEALKVLTRLRADEGKAQEELKVGSCFFEAFGVYTIVFFFFLIFFDFFPIFFFETKIWVG